jgi:uncharacterized protein YcbX
LTGSITAIIRWLDYADHEMDRLRRSVTPLTTMAVSQGQGLSFDRAFALALGTTRFDPEAPKPLDKGHFLMLRKNEKLAALATRLDPETGTLTIRHRGKLVLEAVMTGAAGRVAIEDFMASYLGEETEGRPHLVSAVGHKFTDVSVISPVMMKAISVINLASVRALEEATRTPLHPLRFRANIYLDDAPAWAELDWLGREVEIGGIRFRGALRTRRCAALPSMLIPRPPRAMPICRERSCSISAIRISAFISRC